MLVTADAPSVKPTRAPSAGLAVGVTRRQAEPAVRYLVQADR